MKLIVGLGNPGKKYRFNRHNVGFQLLDYLIEKWKGFKIGGKEIMGELYRVKATGKEKFPRENFLLLKPTTFMNLSGKSVGTVARFYKIAPSEIVVIHDDLDLKVGQLRFKKGGGNGGHNGLKSIDTAIGPDYWRVRIGIGRPSKREQVVEYVLGDFDREEWEQCIRPLFPIIELGIGKIERAGSIYSRKGCK